MSLFDRYIARELAKTFFLAMAALVPLFSFLDLIQELDKVGKGSYGLGDVLLYELRMAAPRSLDLLPFGALVGSTLGLAILSQNSELVAAQASGLSIPRIAWSVLKFGLALVVVATLLDEFVVSPLHRDAVRERSLALSDTRVLPSAEGFWINRRNTFVRIGRIEHGRVPRDLDVVELGDDGKVRLFIHADEADIADPGRWRLSDARVKRLDDGAIVNELTPEWFWQSHLTAEQVGLLEIPPVAMSPSQLYLYIDYLRSSGQGSNRHEMAFWRRITVSVATCAMMLLAVRFAFGDPRSQSAAKRVIVAIGAGILFQIANQIVANAGLVFDLNPVLSTVAVPITTMIIALTLLRRLRS